MFVEVNLSAISIQGQLSSNPFFIERIGSSHSKILPLILRNQSTFSTKLSDQKKKKKQASGGHSDRIFTGCQNHLTDINLVIKNIFIMKNLTDFRKTVETGVDPRLNL